MYPCIVRWPSTWSSTSPRGPSQGLPVVHSPSMTSTFTESPVKPGPKSPMGLGPGLGTALADRRAVSCGGRTTCTRCRLAPSATPSAPTRCRPPWSASISGLDSGLWNPTLPDELLPFSSHLFCISSCWLFVFLRSSSFRETKKSQRFIDLASIFDVGPRCCREKPRPGWQQFPLVAALKPHLIQTKCSDLVKSCRVLRQCEVLLH